MLVLAGALLCAPGAHAAELSIPHERFELDNGLDVILAPDDSTPIVRVNVWYWVGSRGEAAGLTGFAHLFEHLMFQGSPSVGDEYFAPLEAVGGNVNGTTNSDRTNYFEEVPREYLPLALFLESDRMGWLLDSLDESKLVNQKDVVRNERRQRIENQPYGDWFITLNEQLYPEGHGYHHPTIGSHDDVQNASLDDVKAFFRKWYVPNNASLVISGDFDTKTAKGLVRKYFADIPSGEEPERAEPELPHLAADVEVRQYDDVPEQKVWIGWHSPALFAKGDAELDLLSFALGDGKDSRLYRELVLERQIATEIRAAQWSRGWSSSYMIWGTAAEGHTTDELVAAVDEVIDNVLNGEGAPTAEELEAARANYERGYYQRLSTIGGKAETLNAYNRNLGTPDGLQQDLDRYLDVDVDAVVTAGKAILGRPRVTLHIWPESDKPAPTPEVAADPGTTGKKKKKKKKKKSSKPAPEVTP